MLDRSAELAPKYALTWAHLGRTHTANASFQFGGAGEYQKAQAAFERAISLQPIKSIRAFIWPTCLPTPAASKKPSRCSAKPSAPIPITPKPTGSSVTPTVTPDCFLSLFLNVNAG